MQFADRRPSLKTPGEKVAPEGAGARRRVVDIAEIAEAHHSRISDNSLAAPRFAEYQIKRRMLRDL